MDLSQPPRRYTPPGFAQVGRPPRGGRGEVWSKPLILLIAVGIFASFVSLLWELQRHERLTVVEVSFMEEEAAAAEVALEQAAATPAAPTDDAAPAASPETADAP